MFSDLKASSETPGCLPQVTTIIEVSWRGPLQGEIIIGIAIYPKLVS